MEDQGCRNVIVVIGSNGYCAGLVRRGGNVCHTGIAKCTSSRWIYHLTNGHNFTTICSRNFNLSVLRYLSLREKVFCVQTALLDIAAVSHNIYRLADCSGVGSFSNGNCCSSALDIVIVIIAGFRRLNCNLTYCDRMQSAIDHCSCTITVFYFVSHLASTAATVNSQC